jgi:hypothetical protein
MNILMVSFHSGKVEWRITKAPLRAMALSIGEKAERQAARLAPSL